MEKRNFLPQASEKPKKPSEKKIKPYKVIDPCLVCDKELYMDGEFTQRVGLIDDADDLYGWMCPHCESEFDMDGKIKSLNGDNNISGEA
jgi:hypothetical protein